MTFRRIHARSDDTARPGAHACRLWSWVLLILFPVIVISQAAGQTTIYFPFYQADADAFVGVAVSNYSDQPANLEFKAYDTSGTPLPWPSNPALIPLGGRSQVARLGSDLFGVSPDTVRRGWLELETDNPGVGSFFQFGNFALTQLDGSVGVTEQNSRLYFTRVFDGPDAFQGRAATTWISIANPNAGPLTFRLSYLPPESGTPAPAQMTGQLPGKGYLYESAAQLFGQDLAGGYIDLEVTEGGGAVGFELVRLEGQDTIIGLNASGGNTQEESFSAQLAEGPGIFTNVKLINTAAGTRQATLTIIGEEGNELADAVTVTLEPGQSLEQNAGEIFGLADASRLSPAAPSEDMGPASKPLQTSLVGSMRISATGDGVIGDVIFGDPDGLEYAAALPLQTQAFREAVFSHVANVTGFFTGLAFFNPAQETAEIRIEVFSPDGESVGQATLTLGPGRRLSKLVDQLVPTSEGQAGGFVRITSTQPVIAQQLFGTSDLTLLSAVPPTEIAGTPPPQSDGIGPGSFWEYRVLETGSKFAQGSDPVKIFELGRFRVTLGEAVIVEGVAMHDIEVSGLSQSVPIRWARLGVDSEGRYYGSEPGGPLQILYDPTGAPWAGGGFFTEFPEDRLMATEPSTFSGLFFNGPADRVQQSFEQDNCELILGMLICGGEPDINISRKEYWSPSLGPLGLLFSSSFSDCGGGFCSGSSSEIDVGLVRSSTNGDSAGYALETEPSQLFTPVPIPRQYEAFLGFAESGDASDGLSGIGGSDLVHDAYSFTLDSDQTVAFLATWSEDHEADLDFFIVNDPPTILFASSNSDNVGLNDYSEYLEANLSAGNYLLLVQHFSVPKRADLAPPPVEYLVVHTLGPP